MRRVVFSGTSEGRTLCEQLSAAGLSAEVCVATDYGRAVMPELDGITVHTGRMTETEMEEFLWNADLVVDATHPYAVEVSKNIRAACMAVDCRYIRLLRPEAQTADVIHVPDADAAAEYLSRTEGPILLTVGSKQLSSFTVIPQYEKRLWVRALPMVSALDECKRQKIPADRLFLMQGPFSEEMNAALLRKSGAKWLVTKDTGTEGGLPEKLAAAKSYGCQVVLIDRPEEDGCSPDEVRRLVVRPEQPRFPLFVDLTGRSCLVVGCGAVGAHRAEVLLRYGARVTVVSQDGDAPAGAEYRKRTFRPEDMENRFLVVAATDNRELNYSIYRSCRIRNIFVSTADNRDACTFFFPAVRTGAGLSAGIVSDGSDHKKTARAAREIGRILEEIQEGQA